MSGFCKNLLVLPLIVCAMDFTSGIRAEENGISLEVIPQRIEITIFYNGAMVNVDAEVRNCDGVVLTLKGSDKEVTLKRKGRVGLVWMNVADLTVKNAPQVYLLSSSGNLDTLCSHETMTELALGYEALNKRIVFTSDKPFQGWEFKEFIKLKEHEGSYKISRDIRLEPTGKGTYKCSSGFKIPPVLSPGSYQIVLYCFKGGNLIGKTSKDLIIEKTGLPYFMSNIAYKYPAVYGIMAIVIALAAGITIGVLFNRMQTE